MLKRTIGIFGSGGLALLFLAGCLGEQSTGLDKSLRRGAHPGDGNVPEDSVICLIPEGCGPTPDPVIPVDPTPDPICPNPKPVEPDPDSGWGCITLWDPVCGEDGVTYGNSCEAHGKPIAHKGECTGPTDPVIPGYPEPDPEVCLQVITVVCGTDGVTYTYPNSCVSPRVTVAHQGACGSVTPGDPVVPQ